MANTNPSNWAMVMAKKEIEDVKKFWMDLSWWEQEDSISSVEGWIKNYSLVRRTNEQEIEFQTLLEECERLRNKIKRPSNIMLWLHLTPKEKYKPNARVSIHIILSLPEEDLIALARYLGFSDTKEILNNFSSLYDFFMKVLTNGSLSMFYATRNYLGSRYRLKI
jgi:hypothetical protein